MDCSSPGSSVRGIFQARILEWVAISCPRGSSCPRGRTHVSVISCLGRWVLHHCATWKARKNFTWWELENGSLTWRIVQEIVRGPSFISRVWDCFFLLFFCSHPQLCVSDVLSQLEQVEDYSIMENVPCRLPLIAGVEPLNPPRFQSLSSATSTTEHYSLLPQGHPPFQLSLFSWGPPCFLALGPLITMLWFLVNFVC